MKKFLNLSKIAIAVFFVAIVLKGGCPPVDPPDHTILLPNPDCCNSFFRCSDGVPILQCCPNGLHFNAHLNVCDFPGNAGCEGPTCECAGSGGGGGYSCTVSVFCFSGGKQTGSISCTGNTKCERGEWWIKCDGNTTYC